jgi:NAD(P)-dependent dehydrogenase (short-subunit alcohol dehydrogenase family)
MRLKGKIALVMGTEQESGASIAEALVDEGAVVCVAGPNPVTGAALTASLRNRGGIAMALVCDFADRVSVDNAVSETISIFGRIDIFANSGAADALP